MSPLEDFVQTPLLQDSATAQQGDLRILLVDVDLMNAFNGGEFNATTTQHPVGLMSLASHLKEAHADIHVRIIHTATIAEPFAFIAKLIDDFDPHLVGLRALSVAKDVLKEVAALIRMKKPEVPLVAGGPYPSASYEEVLLTTAIDLAVLGEGEQTFTEIVTTFRKTGALPKTAPGTAVLSDDDVHLNPSRPFIEDLDTLPFPDYSLIRLEDYAGLRNSAMQGAANCAFITASRGCPYHCFYCHNVMGKHIRRRSPENIVKEMRSLSDTKGIRNFVFTDDVFNIPRDKARAVLLRICRELPGVRLNFPNGLRGDQLDDELIDLFVEAGTIQMSIAVETPSPRLQKIIGKNANVDRLHRALERASQKLMVHAFFMIGFPSETEQEALETLKFAISLPHIVNPILFIVRVFRGTPLWDILAPNAQEASALEKQEKGSFFPNLREKTCFYGDLFSRDKVPLTSEKIHRFYMDWVRLVSLSPTRLAFRDSLLDKFFFRPEKMNYYRQLFNDPNFDPNKITRLLSTT